MIKCEVCGREYWMITHTHLKKHNMAIKGYKRAYPNAELVSKEYSERQSKTVERMWANPDFRSMMMACRDTPEAKERYKKASKKRMENRETRNKIRLKVNELWRDPEYVEKHRKGMEKPEVKKKLREQALEQWKDPEFRKLVEETMKRVRLHQVFPRNDTKIEVLMQKGLKHEGLEFETHYPIIGQPDIAFPDKKVAIFCDGCYWHACPIHFPNGRDRDMEKDGRIEKALTEMGWVVLRFWEHEINENLEGCVEKVMEVVM